ncbi:MAG: FxsA family protein [Bacillota bacterium]
MFLKLLLLFTVVPLIELALLLKVGQLIGITYTIAIIILTGFAGVVLAKQQGFIVLKNLRNSMMMGQMPGDAIFDGVFILAGGLVLLTPGLITDAIGFLFLIPFTREIFKDIFRKMFRYYIETGHIKIFIK